MYMNHAVQLNALAKSMLQATIAKWLVNAGDAIQQNQPLYYAVVDKVTIQVDSDIDGILRRIDVQENTCVPVGTILAWISDSENESEKLPSIKQVIIPPYESDLICLRKKQTDVTTLDAMRKTIAMRMTDAKNTMPHFYLTAKVDMSHCAQLRKSFKKDGIRVTYNDMLIKAVAIALEKYPRITSRWTNEGYQERSDINIGFAVATLNDGLVVPVIRNANNLSLINIADETKRLIHKTSTFKLTPDDYGDAVFTISNLGQFEVEEFGAIINPGESAILSVGKMADEPAVIHHEIVIRPIVRITLSSDHRVIDGALAAKFIGTVKRLMEMSEETLN